jgi:hypothetical protein
MNDTRSPVEMRGNDGLYWELRDPLFSQEIRLEMPGRTIEGAVARFHKLCDSPLNQIEVRERNLTAVQRCGGA